MNEQQPPTYCATFCYRARTDQAKIKKFEMGFQSLGWALSLPIGIAAVFADNSQSLPLLGTAGEKLPTAFYKAVATVALPGVFANFYGNFGASIDVIISLISRNKKIKDLTFKEAKQVIGSLLGTAITLPLISYITASGTNYPIIGKAIEFIPAWCVQIICIPFVGGAFANEFGHAGKGLDHTVEIARSCFKKKKADESVPVDEESAVVEDHVASAPSTCTLFYNKIHAIAKNKGFERAAQSLGWNIGNFIGIIAALSENNQSLPLIGNVGERLTSIFFKIVGLSALPGVFANFYGNFGSAIDTSILLAHGEKKCKDLTFREAKQISGSLLGIGVYVSMFFISNISASATVYPITGKAIESIPTWLVHIIALPFLAGAFANEFGHFGKGLDHTIELFKRNNAVTTPDLTTKLLERVSTDYYSQGDGQGDDLVRSNTQLAELKARENAALSA